MKEMRRLLKLFFPYWRWMCLGIGAAVVTFLGNVGLMAVSGWFLASMAVAGLTHGVFNYFTPAAAIRALAIARTIGRYLERLLTHEATLRLLAHLRVWFYRKLEPLVPARLAEYRSGDLLSRIRADIDTLDNFYVRLVAPVTTALLGTAVCVAILAVYCGPVALTTLLLLAVSGILVPLLVQRLGAESGRGMVETSAYLRANVVDGLQGMGELRVFGAAERQARSVAESTETLLSHQARMSFLQGMADGSLGLCANLAVWAAVILLVPRLMRDNLPRVDLALIVLMILATFEAVMPLPEALRMLGHTLTAARRIFTLVDAEPGITEPEASVPVPESFAITMDKVSFRYAPKDPWALRDIQLRVPPGGRVAVIGPTGSGKTTLINLLLRFRDCDQGSIDWGGRPLSDYQSSDIHRAVAVVSQDTHLFNTTIRENILLARPEADREELVAAARAARLHEFVESLPEGYDTFVGEAGVRLSGGQARRVAVARAVLKDAPLLILDEPTEGLDAETARELMDSLLNLMKGRSVLLVTHRLAGLRAMDEVVFLEGGRIAARGRHEDLLRQSARYRHYHDLLAKEPLGTIQVPHQYC
jgi:ATP-binding cassette subfamily C protein CydC